MKHLLCILSIVSAVGCSKNRDGIVELKFWAMGNEGENVQKLLPAFEREHPEIRVNVQQIPWIAAHEKLLTAFAGSSLPDVCQLGNTWIPEFSSLGALEPLDTLLKEEQINPSSFFEGPWNSNVVDGITYGVPWYVDTRVLFYRTDILASAGFPNGVRTWEEWQTACERIVQAESKRKQYAIFLPTNEWVPSVVLGLEASSTLLKDNDTRGDFGGEAFRSAYRFLSEFYVKGYAPASMTEVTNVYHGFAEGYFAMYITGPWNIGEFRRRLPANVQDRWMTAPLPSRTPDKACGTSLPGGSSLVLFTSSSKKREAAALIEFLSRTTSQLEFYRYTGNLPSRREAWNDSAFANNKYMRAFYVQLQSVQSPPKVPEWEQIAIKIQEHSELLAQQTRPIDEILRSLDSAADRILAKRRWLLEHGRVRNRK